MNNFSMPSLQEMDQLINFCKVMAQAPFYQKLGAGGVLAIYMTAKELNLPFMACLNGGLFTYDGKVSFSGILINALILRAGHTADLIEINDERCRILFTRGDRKNDPSYQPMPYEYTTEMAAKAGYLKKDNWKNSLRDMLYNRCITGGGRKHIPEVFVGVLVDGEMCGTNEDAKNEPHLPVEAALQVSNSISIKNEPIQIEHQPVEGFQEFMERHGLFLNSEENNNRKMEFVKRTAEKSNMDQIKLLNYAVQNEEYFEKQFKAWEKENYPITE